MDAINAHRGVDMSAVVPINAHQGVDMPTEVTLVGPINNHRGLKMPTGVPINAHHGVDMPTEVAAVVPINSKQGVEGPVEHNMQCSSSKQVSARHAHSSSNMRQTGRSSVSGSSNEGKTQCNSGTVRKNRGHI